MNVKLAVAIVGVVVCALALAVGGIGPQESKSAKAFHASAATGNADAQPAPPDGGAGVETDMRVSLEGDEITSAVAKYLIDENGELYELHAPQTEITRLGAPES